MKKYFLLIVILWACGDDSPPTSIASDKYSECNSIIAESCPSLEGDYCLFGFKWGEGNDFSPRGTGEIGPRIAGGIITYSFQENASSVSNHRQENVPAESFDRLAFCAKEEIRRAINDWSEVANISFEEMADDSESDIKFFVANVTSRGNGFPRYSDSRCTDLNGHVILSPTFTSNCRVFYLYVLHEFGHTLGLGHASRSNIMGASLHTTELEGLQEGDIEGLRQIYGE